MSRRQIDRNIVKSVLENFEFSEEVREGRWLFQKRISLGEPSKIYLFRVFVDIDKIPAEVVTVYKTSRVKKYFEEVAK
ncbi:MAG: hypothetical protein COT16_00610 [Elusimicrobia bacterium CG08_land_8_20_14_0_20_44_26]|nr:MAG: hypothetical protein COT16_00610 [Elusimicrobia bacterium CG08_land_8_20_14_0_20_44_26]